MSDKAIELEFDFLAGRVHFSVYGDRLSQQIQNNFVHLRAATPGEADLEVELDARAVPSTLLPQRIRVALPDFDTYSSENACKCIHHPLLQWHARRGAPVWHAAAVSWEGRAVLFVGPSDCGKTTLALECAKLGAEFLGDDYIAVRDEGKEFVAGSLYAWAWIAGSQERRVLLPLYESNTIHMVSQARLQAVVAVDQKVSGLQSARSSEVLRWAAPSNLLQLPGSNQNRLEDLASILQKLPCYRGGRGSAAEIRDLLQAQEMV